MDQRRAAGALLALAVCIASTAAAPTVSNQTGLDLYEGSPEGCYYNFQHYGEGDRIMTNEPCLNCTCHNRMLMCYLRVCPFTKPIGQDCTVEKRADQCCPIVTCPDVPVDLLTSTSTTSPAEYGATGVGKLDKYGCSINGKYFPEGAKVPPTPNKPCEHCYCIRNMTTCVMQECTLHVDGCTPIYHKDVCCPVRYSCDHPEDTTLFLDDMTTTVRPTPGYLLTTTTLSPVTQMSQDCVHDDQIFSDGALIKTEKACEHCYCMKGDIVCVVQECGMPMENEGKNCTSQTPREGQCCPDTYICEGDDFTTEPPSEFTTQSLLEELTTLTPPRRVAVEGSGYRKETEQPAETEAPSIETEPEGSGYEESTEPAAFDDNALTPETPETITETIDESFYSSRTTVRTPTLEEIEKTTEPDKGLNTVPSDASDEEMYKPSLTEKTPFEESEVTESTLTEDKKPEYSEEKTASPEDIFTQAVTAKSEESAITTESAFRKEDALGEPTEIYDLGEPEKTSTQATDIEKETEEDDTRSKTKAPFMEELEKQTTSSPFTQKDIEQEIPSKKSTTESVLEVTTSAYVKPTDKLTTDAIESSQTESTRPTEQKEGIPETTDSDQNEVEDILTTLPPARIPGEGDCLLNDITYRNNSNVPSTNNCHTSCRCVSSIVKCDPIICSPPPEYMDNCQPTYDSPDACCPTYVCHTGETMPPQPHSQMSGTDSPLIPPPIKCHGDECAIRKDDNVPVVGDCGSAGCGEGQSIPETQPESCQDGKCSYPVQPCADGNCQETPTVHCENGKCGIEPEIVPVKDKPLCENEADCKVTVPEVPSCEGEHCDSVNVGCAGTECSLDSTKQPEQGEESCKEGCKTPEGETSEPCTETPCRRKESGEVDTAIPSECSGSECDQKVPSKEDDVNVFSTTSPVTEGTSAKSTQELEITTKASEDASGYGPTEMFEQALEEGSTSGPLPQVTEQPETLDEKYSGTEASTELDRTTESRLDKDVTKSPIEKESSTSEPQILVTDAITNEPEETATKIHEEIDKESPVTESQAVTTKAQSEESLEISTTQHAMHSESTESPQDTDDIRTAGPLEYSTSMPERQDTMTELPELQEEPTTKASEQQKPDVELSPEPEKTDVDKVNEEPVAYTPEMDMVSTKLPESDVKQDVTESYAPLVTDTSHDVTESNEIVDEKATKVPESVDSDEHKVLTEMFQHEPTTEGAVAVSEAQEQETDTSHATSSENDLEQAPFTNAPSEPSLDDRTGITESVTEKITEASTAKSSEDTSDVSSKSPEELYTEKHDHFTESPEEYITEPQETSTRQPALAGEEPELTTDEAISETEQPISEEDTQSQTTSASPVVDVKIKDESLPSDTETKEEGTTQASVSDVKTTVTQPALDDEKEQPTESSESNELTQEFSEKPAVTESLDTLTTKQPFKIPTYDDSTDVPATQDITEQQEISTEEPSVESESPITDKIPSEPYLPVHPEATPKLPTAQSDVTNEIPDTEPVTQTPASDKELEIETKIPDRSGLDEATEVPESMDTESPEVKVPETVTEGSATQAPEVFSESPAVHKDEETQPIGKPFETETSPDNEMPEKTPETIATEQEEIDAVTTEKIQEQPPDNEQTSKPEKYATVSIVHDTTVSSVAQQESSEQPELTDSDISYATSAPESHVKEPQKPVTETPEMYPTKSHIGDETATEGSQEVSSEAPEKPSEEKPSVYHDEQPEEKPETQDETSTVLSEVVTESKQEVKPQEPQEEEKEDSAVTEPSPYKTTEADIDEVTSAILDQEKMTSDGLQETMTTLQESSTRPPSQDLTTSHDLELPEKYTVSATDAPVQQDTSSPHADSTEKPLEVEDVVKQPTTLKTPLIDQTETLPVQVDKEDTKEPTLYETQGLDITEKDSDIQSLATESPVDKQTTPEIVELEEHSHKPLEETSTVDTTEEEITDLQEHHFDEEKEKPQEVTEKPAAVTTFDEDRISTPSNEYSPDITKGTTIDLSGIPSESTPRPSDEEGGQDSNVPTTSQPTIEVGDTRFGDDTSQEEPQPTKASPESELTSVSEIEIPVQTERVPSEKVTESELSHETLMLEEITPVTTKQDKEITTERPEYGLPDETPLEETPQGEPSKKPSEDSSEKPSEEETVQPEEESEKKPSDETESTDKPSEETEKSSTETPLEEPAQTVTKKPLTEEKPAETPEQKPLEEEVQTEIPQEGADLVTTEEPLVGPDTTPEEKPEEKPLEETEKTPAEEPTEAPLEGIGEKLSEKPDEQPEVRPVDEFEEKVTEKPFEAEEKPSEVEEKPLESPEEKPEETPDEQPLRTPEEKPVETPEEIPEEKPFEAPEEKPQETLEEKPQETPEEKPQERPEETPEVPTEKPLDEPEEKPQEVPEEKPQEAPKEKPQELPEGKPQEAHEEKPQEEPGEKPQEQPEEQPEEKPTEAPQEKPQEATEEKPQEVPEEKPEEAPEEKPQEVPEEASEEKPQETSEEKPQETPEEKPQETPEEKPQETPEEKPQETSEEKPQEVPEEKPQELPAETPDVPTEKPIEEPKEKPEETLEEKPQETPEEKPQEVPEEKPQGLPEGTPDVPTEKPIEESKEKAEETPETTTQAPEEKPQETPEEKPQEIPEEKPQEVPETKPQEKPQELPEETAQEVPAEKPQEVPEEKPQEAPTDKPEEIPEEKPEEKPQEELEQKPQDVLEEKPAEPASTASPDISRPGFGDMEPTDEVPDDFPPSGGTSGYGTEPEYVEEDQAFGPGTCRYGGKVYVSAQQIPRDDPCDFCFCFRSDIICLQQSCPPPIHGCHEEPIQGFCCPRYECPVAMATTLNVTTTTTTTTTTLPPHFLPHAYKGAAQRRGCQIKGHTYKVGEVVRASSGPCLHCTCGGDGQMKCDPKACTPEPMLRQMIAAAVSAKRRR